MDAKTICNLGLGKIAASRVVTLSPPRSPVEKHCADGYANWRDDELGKRRWVFALEAATLTQAGDPQDKLLDGRKYKYALPNDCLKPIRDKHTEWVQRGLFLWSAYSSLPPIEYIRKANENEFPADFVNVLAARVAMESTEFCTQSNTKLQNAGQLYKDAVQSAGRSNAFVIGPEDTSLDDDNSTWITARW